MRQIEICHKTDDERGEERIFDPEPGSGKVAASTDPKAAMG